MFLHKNKLIHLRTLATHQNSLRLRQKHTNFTVFCTCLKHIMINKHLTFTINSFVLV